MRGLRERTRRGGRGLCGGAAAAVMLCCASSPADAQTPSDLDPFGVEIHAFISQGFLKTTQNNYLASSQQGSFEFTEVGINFTKSLTDKLRVGLQIFAQDLGPVGNYQPRLDWASIDYRARDWFGIRVGRVKIPFGLYNESSDIDAARVPILLPQSVYPIDHRDYLLAQTGGEVYGNLTLGPVGSLEYRLYGGTLQIDPPASPLPGVTYSNVSVPYIVGGRLMWSPPIQGLQLGASGQAVRLDWDYDVDPSVIPALQAANVLPAGFTGQLPVSLRAKLFVASAEYQAGNLLLAAEYSRWILDFESDIPNVLAPRTVNERYYGMMSYRMAPWFTPGAYYSVYYPNVDQRAGRSAYQHDLAVTTRYDINAHWLAKLEGHWMHGTAVLDPTLNNVASTDDLAVDWGLLMVKTTAYF